MISDIDEHIKFCILRSFADNTCVGKKISSDEDKKKMQADLEIIYEWARKNKMVFNYNKFKQIAYGYNENAEIEP